MPDGMNVDPPQLRDDPALLELMMSDSQAVDGVYKLTNYWALYAERIAKELRTVGLTDCRRRRRSSLMHFRGSEAQREPVEVNLRRLRVLYNRFTRRIPGWGDLLDLGGRWIARNLGGSPIYDIDHAAAHRLIRDHVLAEAARTSARPVTDFTCSLAGNPDDVIEIEGKPYTVTFLDDYLRYVYLSQQLDLASFKAIVELGGGLGTFTDLLCQAAPQAAVFFVEIPPILYVGHQYLSAVYPDRVVPHGVTRGWTTLEAMQPGRIHILGNWKFPLLKSLRGGLFVNCASFAEMEPDVVANYLSIAGSFADAVYLVQGPRGMAEARRPGLPGVLKRTTFEHYQAALEGFRLVDRRPEFTAAAAQSGQHHAVWLR